MIIGDGLLGSSLKRNLKIPNHDIVIFASGVSNSSEIRASEFTREIDLLSEYLRKSLYIIYFSTCSIYDEALNNSPYVQHKLRVEEMLLARGKSLIIRLPQIAGFGGNENNLLNFLHKKIVSGSLFDIWVNAKRSLIDVDDVCYFTQKILDGQAPHYDLINIAAPNNISISDLVKLIENSSGIKANYRLVDAGSDYLIDVTLAKSVFDDYSVKFHRDYFESIVVKYFSQYVRNLL
jgi:hypothetical protein